MDLSPVSPGSSQPLEVSQPGRTVARRLTAPITIISICQTILQVAETPEVGDYIGEALHQLTIMERTSIRSFARKLSHLCDKNDEIPITAASPPLTAETESSRATLIHEAVPNLILDDNDAGLNSIGATNPAEPSISRKKVLDTSRRGDTNGITRDPVCRALLDQPVADFIYESYCQVQRLSLPGKAPEQDRALAEAFQGLNLVEEEHTWSDGCQYIEELDSLDSDRYIGSLRTAALSVSFARWHRCKVKWLENTTDMTSQSATNSVFESGLGPKPQEPGARQDEWKRRRQRSSTSCTRGKKWLRLLDAFDDDILFKVGLGKSRDTELDTLIIELTHQIQKVEVLGLLSEQIKFISNTGRTSPALFREQLVKRGYPDPYATSPTTGSNKVDAFVDEVRGSNTSGRLLIPRANFKFDIASLQRLATSTWLNDDIVLACLHLSTRLPSFA
ncbi:hypothetical protein FOVG_01423 [Fusarium oxysporum f. sp. pisi HDV247]|uniref:Uncharacterized protein n=1 Tax=Fusarium oxysporum f. sp. pisi HDV247 TaxID=1080344 RepID=W9Q819_FUSOX|nr:hypothetical protein FOVG_01423 [Fusarium oxysporum f. sp. pisi HDV247]